MSKYHAASAMGPFRRHAPTVVKAIGGLLALSVVTKVAWNLFVPELFGLPGIHAKEAVGIVMLTAIVAGLFRRGSHGIDRISAN